MRKVILSKELVQAALDAEQKWFGEAPRFAEDMERNSFEAMKVALEAAIPLYLETDEPGRWQYGVNRRDIVGGPFNRYEWFDSKEAAQSELDIITNPRNGQYRNKGDGHGVAARPCRRWIGRPFWEETFDELDEWDNVPQASFTLHDATPEQSEEIFDKVIDHIYEVAEQTGSGISVTGSLIMGGVPKGRTVKDESTVPLPGPGE